MEAEPPQAYSIPEAQRHLGDCSRPFIYDLIRRGQLRTVKVGSRRLVPRSALLELLGESA